MTKSNQLTEIHKSGKSYAIYKSIKGFDLYTDFSKKIILNNQNIYSFLNKKKFNYKKKSTDLFIGFFGYELLNNLIGIKIPKQKNINFPKGIFYKPEKKITFSNNLVYNQSKKITVKKILILILTKNLIRKFLTNLKKKSKVEKPTK